MSRPMPMPEPADAIVLFAHGARDARWAEPFEAVAARLREQAPGAVVVLAYLEMMQPDLPSSIDRLAIAGARRIAIVPLFLGTGGHLRKDMPPLVEAARAAHPGLDIRLHPAIGEHAAVVDAMASAARGLAGFGE